MEIIVLAPGAGKRFTGEQKRKIESAGGRAIFVDGPKPFSEISELYSDEPKIVAIDPDFCDWKVPNEALGKIKNLKALCLQTTSFSWIDIEYCRQNNTAVVNLRGFSANAVAEWAIWMALTLARKMPILIKHNWKGDYAKDMGTELRGKTAGVVGLGTNGKRVAEICAGIGMDVIYWSKNTKDNRFKRVELSELMKTADIIFPCFAHNNETEKLLTDDVLKYMKSTAIFVGTIHHIYNHDLLLNMVSEGKLFGYGFEQGMSDPKEFGSYEGNVLAAPEMAWATEESMAKNADLWTAAICNAANGNYPTRVN